MRIAYSEKEDKHYEEKSICSITGRRYGTVHLQPVAAEEVILHPAAGIPHPAATDIH